MNINRNINILHTIYNVKYDGYGGWLVGDETSVVGSIEVPSFGDGDGVVGDVADSVGVAVIDDDVDGIGIGCDCGIGDCCGGGFVFCFLRDFLSFFISFIIIKIK